LISHPSVEIRNDEIILSIRAYPNSTEKKIVVTEFSIEVYVKESADKGKANRSILALISKTYNISSSSLSIIRGLKTRNKIILIKNQNPELFLAKVLGKEI
jgi:uncharacterized protein (TIGR00251 family)